MSTEGDQASDQARFGAREFVARLEREMGAPMSEAIRDRVAFAFEMGYLRGRGEGLLAAMQTLTEIETRTKEIP